MTVSGTQDTTGSTPGMRFSIDAWDVSYGTALAIAEDDLPASAARVETDVETPADQWAPIPVGSDVPHPSAVLFVDGVRRIDARVWIDDSPATGNGTANRPLAAGLAATASMAVCASYAAGVVCCCGHPGRRQAHLLAAEIRRGLFTTAAHATDIQTRAGTYRAQHTVGSDTVPLTMTLSNALQQALARDRGHHRPRRPRRTPPRRRARWLPAVRAGRSRRRPARHRRAPAQPGTPAPHDGAHQDAPGRATCHQS